MGDRRSTCCQIEIRVSIVESMDTVADLSAKAAAVVDPSHKQALMMMLAEFDPQGEYKVVTTVTEGAGTV